MSPHPPTPLWYATGLSILDEEAPSSSLSYDDKAVLRCTSGKGSTHRDCDHASGRSLQLTWNLVEGIRYRRTCAMPLFNLTTGIRSEKRVVRRFRRCANVIQCTYKNLGSTAQCFSTFVRPRPGKFFFHKKRARSQQIYSSVTFQFFFLSSYIKIT